MPRLRNISQGPDEQTVEKRFAPAVTGADDARRAATELTARLERAFTTVIEREHARVAVKYGAQSAQAQDAGAAVRVQQRVSTFAAANAQRARSPAPKADQSTFIVHGRAVDESGIGVAGLLAALTTANQERKVLARTKTDDNGYFKLVLDTSSSTHLIASESSERALPVADAARSEAAGRAQAGSPATLRLVLSHGDGELFHEDIRDVKLGEARYREVVVKKPR